jgi:hypothetical protein
MSSDAAGIDNSPKHKVTMLRETYSCTEHPLMPSVRPLDWQHYQRSLYGSPKRRFMIRLQARRVWSQINHVSGVQWMTGEDILLHGNFFDAIFTPASLVVLSSDIFVVGELVLKDRKEG